MGAPVSTTHRGVLTPPAPTQLPAPPRPARRASLPPPAAPPHTSPPGSASCQNVADNSWFHFLLRLSGGCLSALRLFPWCKDPALLSPHLVPLLSPRRSRGGQYEPRSSTPSLLGGLASPGAQTEPSASSRPAPSHPLSRPIPEGTCLRTFAHPFLNNFLCPLSLGGLSLVSCPQEPLHHHHPRRPPSRVPLEPPSRSSLSKMIYWSLVSLLCGCATVSPAEGGSRAWYPQVRGGCDGRAVKGARPSAPQEGPEGGESDRWRPRARSSGARWIRGPRHSSEAGLALAWLSVRGPGPSFGLPPALAGPPLRSPPRARRVCYVNLR